MSQADRAVSRPASVVTDEAAQRGPVELDLALLQHVAGGLPKDSWRTGEIGIPEDHSEEGLPKDTW